MIGKLRGQLEKVGEDRAIIDVNGVGYLVFSSSKTLQKMEATSGSVSLFIETHVREDHIHLYAFADAAEQEWFKTLTTVQGVGAKVALAILSALTADELASAIHNQDKTMLNRANGVGPKLAARLVVELKDKIPGGAGLSMLAAHQDADSSGAQGQSTLEALSALVNLGYKRLEAESALRRAAEKGHSSLDELIRAGLKELAR